MNLSLLYTQKLAARDAVENRQLTQIYKDFF